MFTGIIKKVGVIYSWDAKSRVIGIKSEFDSLILGESISCSGVCLTVSNFEKDIFFCNLSSETVSKTNFKLKKEGDKLNLEKSLKIGEDLSGHLVFGHVCRIVFHIHHHCFDFAFFNLLFDFIFVSYRL